MGGPASGRGQWLTAAPRASPVSLEPRARGPALLRAAATNPFEQRLGHPPPHTHTPRFQSSVETDDKNALHQGLPVDKLEKLFFNTGLAFL